MVVCLFCRAMQQAAIHSLWTKALQTFGADVSVWRVSDRATAWLAYLRVEGEGQEPSVESVLLSVRAKVPVE